MTESAIDIDDASDTSGFGPDELAIWNEQKAIYAAFLTGDRERIDRHIADDVTIWDSESEPLAHGKADLEAIRAKRPAAAAAPTVVGFTVGGAVITVDGDLAVGRHTAAVDLRSAGGTIERERLRVSTGWQRRHGDWYVIHSHEDVVARHPVD